MKLFQTFRNNYTILGLNPNQHFLNEKVLMGFLILFGSASLSFFHLANTRSFKEITESIYITSMILAIALGYVVAVFEMEDLFTYSDNCEKVVNERE